MKGHVRKRGSSWSFVINLGYENGKRKQKWFSGYKTKREAEKAMSQVINELSQGNFVEPSKEKLKDYLALWLKNKKTNIRNSTYENYEILVNKHIIAHIGDITLSKLNAMHLQSFYTSLSDHLAGVTILKIHKTLKTALNQAVKFGLIQKNPADLVDSPRIQKKEMKTWNEDEVHTFLKVAQTSRYYIVYFLAITTGMRRGEILGLRWQDIDFKLKTLHIKQTLCNRGIRFQETKTATGRRSVSLPDITVQELKKHKKLIAQDKLLAGTCYTNLDLVACTSLGTQLNPSNLLREYRRLRKLADITPIRFHDLRHTHATLLLKQGVHPKIVSERLGHSNIKITLDTYTHVLPGLQQAAAERFGEVLFGDTEENKHEKRQKEI